MQGSETLPVVVDGERAPIGDDNAAELVAVVRRVIAARVRDRNVVDDLTQETFARVIADRSRLAVSATVPYAITVACNLVIKHHQSVDRARRSVHLLADQPSAPDSTPDTELMRHERLRAVATALGRLTAGNRKLLLAHELGRVGTAELAQATGVSAGAVTAQLHRSRARLRVEFLLADAGIVPPTARCRPVLLAISSCDRRRQRELNVEGHVLDCECCLRVGSFLARSRGSVPPNRYAMCVRVSARSDITFARHAGRELGVTAGFTKTALTEITTAISEVARKIVDFAAPGQMSMTLRGQQERIGITVVARDNGPGIGDVNRALRDGVGTGHRLGIGLGGARRLMSEFDIRSAVGEGTTITMTKWSATPSAAASRDS